MEIIVCVGRNKEGSPIGLELAKAFVRVRVDSSRLKGDLRGVASRVTSSFRAIAGQISGILATIGVGAGIAGFVGLLRSGEQFNQKMRNSIAIMGDVSEALRRDMKDAAIEAARATQFSATQAAESFFFLASAGLDAKQSIAALPQVALFGQAGMFDMARATDLATDAQSALGLTVDDASQNLTNLTRVTDVLVKANTLANASVEQFSSSLTNKAGASARAVGKDIEEVVAVLAGFADQGLKGQEAGTAVGIVMRDLQTKAIQNKKAFQQANIAVFDQTGAMRNMADIIEDLENKLGGMSAEQKKVTLAQLGFADKSVVFLQTLLGTSKKIREYERELRKAGGTTKEIADKQLTPLQRGMAKLGAAFTKAFSSLQEFLGPTFEKILTNIADSMDEISAGVIVMWRGIKAVAELILEKFKLIFDKIADLAKPVTDKVKSAFSSIVGFLDFMFGSFEGFKVGVLRIWEVIVFKFKFLWIDALEFASAGIVKLSLFVKETMIKLVKFFEPLLKKFEIDISGDIKKVETELKILKKVFPPLIEIAFEAKRAPLRAEEKEAQERFEKRRAELPKVSEIFKGVLEEVRGPRELRELLDRINKEELGTVARAAAEKAAAVGGAAGGVAGIGELAIAPGRVGFTDFGRQIQDAILQRQDPQRAAEEKAAKQRDEQIVVAKDTRDFMKNIDEQIMNVGKLE